MTGEDKSFKDFLSDYPVVLRQVLWNRGIRSETAVREFLYPKLSDLPNPQNNLLDLEPAIGRLLHARDQKEFVVIFGDYDVDGATSTTLLHNFLSDMGWRVDFFVPHRIKQGYGVSVEGAKALLQKHPQVKVVVTCDCGVASHEGIELLKNQGVAVIVTDHHEVPKDRVKAEAVLNPKQKNCSYPEKRLAGVGVAFLLVIGLRQALEKKDYALRPLLDLVGLGTVCDLAELMGANRALVKSGLQTLEQTTRPGLRLMMRNLGLEERSINAKDLGFLIGPRLNAVGRMGDPEVGVRALLARTEEEAAPFVKVLEEANQNRRELQENQTEDALERAQFLLKENPDRRGIVVFSKDYHLGLVGLIASRLVEKFQKPVCVMTTLDDEHALADFPDGKALWKGSLRSTTAHHLANAFEEIRENAPGLLVSGGGHAMAAGVAVEEARLLEFEEAWERALLNQGSGRVTIEADSVLNEARGLHQVIPFMEPIGQGNPAPLLKLDGFRVRDFRVMKEKHLKLFGDHQGLKWSVLQFRSPWIKLLKSLEGKDIEASFVAELTQNEWQGRKRVEFLLKDLLQLKVQGEVAFDGYNQSQNLKDEVSTRTNA